MTKNKVYLNEELSNSLQSVQPRDTKGKFAKKNHGIKKIAFYLLLIAGILAILNYALESYVNWRSEFGIRKPYVFNYEFKTQSVVYELPEPEVLSPIVVVNVEKETEFTPVEQKIVDKFGYKDGIVALAIFDCGESGLDQYAVSHTGDLGIAQINWPVWKNAVKEKFGYTAMDMFDVDKNIEVAEWIFNRDGIKDSGDESWEPWSGYNNGSYTRCFK